MLKIKATDTIANVMIKMSEGNPGALTALMKLTQDEFIKYTLPLDTLEIYGSNLYILWNDCCDRDISKVKDIIDSWRSGNLSAEAIYKAIDTSATIEIQK